MLTNFIEFDKLLKELLLSACLGALIGLERQWRAEQARQSVQVGLRTFSLWAVLGTLSAYISSVFTPFFFLIAFLAVATLIGLNYKQEGNLGFTTMTVGLITFPIGGLIYWGQALMAIALVILVLVLLASKDWIRTMTAHLTRQDVHSALQFAAITGVILPIVPNQHFGILGIDAFNPFSTWLMVILVSGLGFLGYATMRFMGAHAGISITGLLGGVASSTATTLAFSRQSRTHPELSKPFALAIGLACNVMLPRVALIVLPINRDVFLKLLIPLAIMSLPGVAIASWWWLHSRRKDMVPQEPILQNPLSLRVAIKFALLYSAIIFAGKVVVYFSGDSAIYLLSFVSGLAQMDAIVLSLAQMISSPSVPIAVEVAARGIMIAAIANTVLKAIVAHHSGSKELNRLMRPFLIWTTLFGLIGFFLMV